MAESKEKKLQRILEENIPLAVKAGFQIEELRSEKVSVGGSLDLNSNHHNTVFGGSISVILILAAWGLVQEVVNSLDPTAAVVISNQSLDFLKPVRTDFTAVCRRPSPQIIDDFTGEYGRKGRARLTVVSELFEKGGTEPCAVMSGTFHVSRRASGRPACNGKLQSTD